jgi:hypothetical protein
MIVLRGAAQHGWSANIDLFDRLLERHTFLGDGFLEWIQVYHHQIDRLDPLLSGLPLVVCVPTDIKQPAMHLRMQGLDPSIHDFRRAGIFGNFHGRDPFRLEKACRSTC